MIDFRNNGRARLVLEDGSVWHGTSFGAEGETSGEIVFNTAMTGYQEVLTDPSYTGQVVLMTAPLVGNYGIADEDGESPRPTVEGFVVREASRIASSNRADTNIRDYLQQHGIVALEGLDTRALTLRIRERGAMRVFMTTEPLSDEELRARVAAVPELVGDDMVRRVTPKTRSKWTGGYQESWGPSLSRAEEKFRVVALDFGAKETIYRSLREVGCDVTVVPSRTPVDEILALEPDGIFLSNGPGDPRPLGHETETITQLVGRVPIFGICLGHQLLAQAVGAEIVKLPFGHHGSNHPVHDISTGKVEITAQNHGFAVTRPSLEALGARVTHINLNDETVAGFELPDRRAFCVQFHPEAAPGPHDSLYLFERFCALMRDA